MNDTCKYDNVPDAEDKRDFKYAEHCMTVENLPRQVDLRAGCSAIKNQGILGSCTGNSLAGATEFETRKAGMNPPDLSRLFIYYNEREVEGTISQDAGAQIRDGVKVLATYGVCPEADWPYLIDQFSRRPEDHDFANALPYKISKYVRLDNTNKEELQHCLASGFPFVFGFSVFSGFESQEVAATGIVNMPQNGETCLGGHAVYAVGYDMDTDRVLVANSWGDGWGQRGFFTIPFAYITNPEYAQDFWTIQA